MHINPIIMLLLQMNTIASDYFGYGSMTLLVQVSTVPVMDL